MGRKVTVSADGSSASVAEATMGDILTTAVSSDTAVTGMHGFVQKAGFVLIGMGIDRFRTEGHINILK